MPATHMRLAIALAILAAPAWAEPPTLALPVDCDLGQTCFVQQLVDRDPGPDARDFTCGPQSYDGHRGTDIRVTDMADLDQGWTVVAAAPGIVRGTRNTVLDGGTAAMPDGQDCGNGVVIDHGDGWETQYCHLAKGSISVSTGDTVTTGTPLGLMGFSGRTEFPHLHLSLRQNGNVVDPFDPSDTATCGAAARALWEIPLSAGDVMSVGFAEGVPEFDAVKAGTAGATTLAADAPALVLWGFFHSGRAGDVVDLVITGPDGSEVHRQSVTLERTQAQAFRASGRRTPDGGWPAGTYTGSVSLIRDGAVLSTRTTALRIT